MSYLTHPMIYFSGKFHADPATINNTPDNYNPNANFPPNNGENVGNNIQLYWNPDGSGKFALDCTVTQVRDYNGSIVANHELVGQPLVSADGTSLPGAKLVDLDPMQQNVTELWGLRLQLPDCNNIELGYVLPSAYSNAWVQVVDGRGDYAGSVQYQSVIDVPDQAVQKSAVLQQLSGGADLGNQKLSVAFVVRAYNSSSNNYLINAQTRFAMNEAGVPIGVTDKLKPIEKYNQGPVGSTKRDGQIPTDAYFTKLVKGLTTAPEWTQYLAQIKANALLPYTPKTEFDFRYGQVFGVIGISDAQAPNFMTPNRMLTPQKSLKTSYFAPFSVNPAGNEVIVNLGNSLQSSQPAAEDDAYVTDLGVLQLCYFDGDVSLDNAIMLGKIIYKCNEFYIKDAGIFCLSINSGLGEAVKTNPLGIISTTADNQTILLHENSNGYYLRANQFVFRMNPGVPTTSAQPRGETQQVKIYVSQFGLPLNNTEIAIQLMPSVEASVYTDSTLGTGGSSGLVNMGVPTSALDFPGLVSTDADGIARFTITASNPGKPRGYVDGQIYFLEYGFADPALKANYVQSADNLISVQVYSQQPNIADITWENFVQNVLGQYGKLYPVMGGFNLQSEASVIANAAEIDDAIGRQFSDGDLMPVTRDLSASRLELLRTWLAQHISRKKSAFASNNA